MVRQNIKKVQTDMLAARVVKFLLLHHGIPAGKMAALCDMSPVAFSASLSRGVPSPRTRVKIEAAFGYQHPIWSEPETLNMRRLCAERFGFDPALLTVRELRRKAAEVGADFSGCLNNSEMIREVLGRVAIARAVNKPAGSAETTKAEKT